MKELDLLELVKTASKNIILILTLSIFSNLALYYHYSSLEKTFSSNIILKNPSLQEFSSDFVNTRVEEDIYFEFISDFDSQVTSRDNFNYFLEEIELRNLINQISINLKLVNKKQEHENRHNLTTIKEITIVYPQSVNGPDILNQYIEYTKKKIIEEFIKKRKRVIESLMNYMEEQLEIAYEINQEYPLVSSLMPSSVKQLGIIKEHGSDDLFYNGTVVLSKQLNHLNKRLRRLETLDVDYNFILDSASQGIWINNNKRAYILFGIFLSIFISFFISILRFKKKK
jgi:LPS O-antigen subunit length determinant protein (WzzB/FepE family)